MQVIGYTIVTEDGSLVDFERYGFNRNVCFSRPYKTKLSPFMFGDESSAVNVANNVQKSEFVKIFCWGKLAVKPVYVG